VAELADALDSKLNLCRFPDFSFSFTRIGIILVNIGRNSHFARQSESFQKVDKVAQKVAHAAISQFLRNGPSRYPFPDARLQ